MIQSNEKEVTGILNELRHQGMVTVAYHPGWPERKDETVWFVLGTLKTVACYNAETKAWGLEEEFLKILVDSPPAPVR